MHINEKVKPYFILLPETDCKDSSLLLSFSIRADSSNKGAYLRLLITDDGQYVEQQTLLLQRKASSDGRFKFQFLIRQSLRKGKAEVRLESTGSLKPCSLHIEKLTIQRL